MTAAVAPSEPALPDVSDEEDPVRTETIERQPR